MANLSEILGELLQEVTSKQKWYSKVFDPVIVQKWKKEFIAQSPGSEDIFDLVISFARSTAQGSFHRDDCQWNDLTPLCQDCIKMYKKQIKAAPADFDKTVDDLSILFADEDWIYDLDLKCEHPRCSCLPPDFDLMKYIRYHQTGLLPEGLEEELKETIQKMLLQEPIDWHPGSKQQVRDLVHPSMYCYVKGVSKLLDGTMEPAVEEDQRYYWLPSEFKISNQGQVEIESKINNLDDQEYPEMVGLLEKTFEAFLPSLEQVMKVPLRGRKLQVITKIATIYLTKENPTYPGGSWHIEGMPYEHIAATGIHYLEVKNISESFLEFRKPVILNEEDPEPGYPQSDDLFTTHHYGITPESHHEGEMNRYLGCIKCDEGSSAVFPNSLQHRVKEFHLIPGAETGIRTILVFFVIDPEKRIISTADIQPPSMTPEEAEFHRERLMFHRKFFVKTLNQEIFERPYSLCEH
jgi:hypothetical protein